jgi:hypothetical protein
MTGTLRTPEARICERCGRAERWDADAEGWRIRTEDGERLVGDPYCIHEWDINGTFSPFED